MAPTDDASESLPSSSTNTAENSLQPFFVLHKASSPRKPEKKSNGPVTTRRRINLSNDADCSEEIWDEKFSRKEAFEAVWSKIESTIKDVLRDMNANVFNEIHSWVRESFDMIKSFGVPSFSEATRSFPMLTQAASKHMFTGLVLTKNVEFVDDLLTFQELGLHLKSQGCHVANLSSLDFSMKNGIAGCLRSLLRQLLMVSIDAADISVLATWYKEQGNCSNPLVIIIDDMERCSGAVLSELILMLSEWVLKIPAILIMGVATTLDAPRLLLSSDALHHLCPCKFILGTPYERMDAVAEAVLVKQCSGFNISHKVAMFMRNYFVNQDGTITSFARALKIACAQHFFMEPLSFLLVQFLHQDDSKVLQGEEYGLSPEMLLKYALDLPSYEASGGNKISTQNGATLVDGLSELKKMQSCWSIVVLCLYEAGKYNKIQFLDILCEALNPALYKSKASDTCNAVEYTNVFPSDCYMSRKDSSLSQAVRAVRDLPAVKLSKLLKDWEKHTHNAPELHEKVKKLHSLLKSEDGKTLGQDLRGMPRRHASRSQWNVDKDLKPPNEKAARLMEDMIGNLMHPIESVAFHEIVCFKNVEKLQMALIGDPRHRIQVDLLDFHKIIRCNCCIRSGSSLLPSMHDSSIMYSLAQEHGDLINLHDWYQSFKSVALYKPESSKRKSKSKHSPSPKKRKVTNEAAKPSEASIQARFCRAVIELQITGLIRMPGKRRPDFVQRVAFGL